MPPPPSSPSISPDKQSGDNAIARITSLNCEIPGPDVGTTSTTQSINHLMTFISTFCDRQATDMTTMIRSSIGLFDYCIPSREAILVFYSELFSEYSTYYWIIKKRVSNMNSQQVSATNLDNKLRSNKPGKIDYVGELTRRFHQLAKLKRADDREDQDSEIEMTPNQVSSPTKSVSNSILTGPESPTSSSQACGSPTNKSSVVPREPKVIPVSRRTSSCNSASDVVDQTPMSPSAQEVVSSQVAEPDDEACCDNELDSVDIFPELEGLVSEVKVALTRLVAKHMNEKNQPANLSNGGERLRKILIEWATELLVSLSTKHAQVSLQVATELNKISPTNLLTRQIELWMENPVNKLLVDLLLESHSDFQTLFGHMISSSHNCDWLLAYTLLEMSKRPNCDDIFAQSMEFMIGSQSNINSLTYILAYLSDNNPKAMTNFPKSNIPFLISLCQSSISLLNVFAAEIPDEISPNFLNNLAKEVYGKANNKGHPTCIESLTHCVIAAPNSYKLLLLAFDALLHVKTSQEVKSAAKVIIDFILIRIHERATQGLLPQASQLMPNPHLHLIDGLLNQINNDIGQLVRKSTTSKQVASKANAIFNRMTLIFGPTFVSKVICEYLNLEEHLFWPLLKPILEAFKRHFGDDGSTLVSQTLSLDATLRTPLYWANMNSLVTYCPELKLDLDLISQLLSDKLCATTFDINSIAQLINLCCSSLERVEQARIRISTKHRLCKALATCYFILLEKDSDEFPKILSHIRISLTCMSLLKESTVASHILCRALLERSLVYGHLFNKNFRPDLISQEWDVPDWSRDESSMRLSKENLKVTLGHRFRRLPNHRRSLSPSEINLRQAANGMKVAIADKEEEGTKPDKQSINSYLLIEAFKSSINNIEAFASLFVEFHCPVMFDKQLWPNDEALRVINEKNLAILRKFEQVPPYWDLFQFIGQAKCLKSCLVLVKALLAAHLALWASATSKFCPDKMDSTSRLIPPLAESGLVPRAFGLTVEVFQHLSPNEVFSVLSDIWQYLKETNSLNEARFRELTVEEERLRSKTYLNRLRLFMCQHMPGSTYVKIFKEFYSPKSEMQPTP